MATVRDDTLVSGVFYHGGDHLPQQAKDGIFWATRAPELASAYARPEIRDQAEGPGQVSPVRLQAQWLFEADRLGNSTTVEAFCQALAAQSGQPLDAGLVEVLRAGARREESGPHYSPHDFWYSPVWHFGREGADALFAAMRAAGFDGIRYTEHGSETIGVFSPEQVVSAITDTPYFASAPARDWREHTRAAGTDGAPVMVFRGEHGPCAPGEGVQHRVATISFGSLRAASVYAASPNRREDKVDTPRVVPAFVDIRRPFVHDADDPFIDLWRIREVVGRERMMEIAHELEDAVCHTNQWDELSREHDVSSIAEMAVRCPEVIEELYLDAYHVFDHPQIVAELAAAGYDGAIHQGNGETACELEYKVFSSAQVIPAFSREFLEWFGDSLAVSGTRYHTLWQQYAPDQLTGNERLVAEAGFDEPSLPRPFCRAADDSGVTRQPGAVFEPAAGDKDLRECVYLRVCAPLFIEAPEPWDWPTVVAQVRERAPTLTAAQGQAIIDHAAPAWALARALETLGYDALAYRHVHEGHSFMVTDPQQARAALSPQVCGRPGELDALVVADAAPGGRGALCSMEALARVAPRPQTRHDVSISVPEP